MIQVQDLVKTYNGKVQAVKGVSFQVAPGEIFGFLGPNGAGKTTTVRILSGLMDPSSGTATVAGVQIPGDRQQLHRLIGVLFENSYLYETMTGKELLLFFCDLYRQPRKLVDELLELVEMTPKANELIKKYSKGMKQRLAIARALLHGPDILVMDEPFTGLDPTMVIELRDSIKRLKGSGLTILLSSHDLHEVNNICDSVVFIKAGKVVNKESVAECHRTMDVQFTILNPTPSILSCLDGYAVIDRSDDGHTIVVKMEKDEVQARLSELVKAGGLVQEVRLLERSVEDLYSELIMEDGR